MGTKSIHFRLPDFLWEKFYQLFPGHGERSAFFRSVIRRVVEKQELKESFLTEVVNKTLEELDDNDTNG